MYKWYVKVHARVVSFLYKDICTIHLHRSSRRVQGGGRAVRIVETYCDQFIRIIDTYKEHLHFCGWSVHVLKLLCTHVGYVSARVCSFLGFCFHLGVNLSENKVREVDVTNHLPGREAVHAYSHATETEEESFRGILRSRDGCAGRPRGRVAPCAAVNALEGISPDGITWRSSAIAVVAHLHRDSHVTTEQSVGSNVVEILHINPIRGLRPLYCRVVVNGHHEHSELREAISPRYAQDDEEFGAATHGACTRERTSDFATLECDPLLMQHLSIRHCGNNSRLLLRRIIGILSALDNMTNALLLPQRKVLVRAQLRFRPRVGQKPQRLAPNTRHVIVIFVHIDCFSNESLGISHAKSCSRRAGGCRGLCWRYTCSVMREGPR